MKKFACWWAWVASNGAIPGFLAANGRWLTVVRAHIPIYFIWIRAGSEAQWASALQGCKAAVCLGQVPRTLIKVRANLWMTMNNSGKKSTTSHHKCWADCWLPVAVAVTAKAECTVIQAAK